MVRPNPNLFPVDELKFKRRGILDYSLIRHESTDLLEVWHDDVGILTFSYKQANESTGELAYESEFYFTQSDAEILYNALGNYLEKVREK